MGYLGDELLKVLSLCSVVENVNDVPSVSENYSGVRRGADKITPGPDPARWALLKSPPALLGFVGVQTKLLRDPIRPGGHF